MIRKLRKKFVSAAVAAVFLVLLVLIGAINVLNYRGLAANADATLQILAENRGAFPRQMFREQDSPPGPELPPAEGQDAPPELQPPPAEERDGGPFDQRRGGSGELAYQSRYFTACFGAEGTLTRLNLDKLASMSEEKGFCGDYRFRRTVLDGETMLLFLNCERELATFRDFLLASVGISLAGTLAVFLLLLLFSGRIVRPIAESYEKQKRFITDAGHELKTPITIIRADADVLQAEMEEENEWIADIRRQTGRLAELTSDLIYLSRMEEENAVLQMQDFSLSELVDETARSFQALARTKNRRFSASVAPGLRVNGDEKALAKLVSILLDNAMKYSPEEGSVELSLEQRGKSARLTVRNTTAPMEKGNAERLFRRFAREDSSRNSESGGFVLGLAIAKAVTEAHKGRIRAESEDGLSLTVTAALPLC